MVACILVIIMSSSTSMQQGAVKYYSLVCRKEQEIVLEQLKDITFISGLGQGRSTPGSAGPHPN